MLSCLKQVYAHIFYREVEDGQPSKFKQQHHVLAVGNGNISEDHTHTPTAVFPAKSIAQ